jgi:hypothetical protein
MMISEAAGQSVKDSFERAARIHLAVSAGDSVVVEPLAKEAVIEGARKIVVLTISSFVFRLLTFFHVSPDDGSGIYFAKGDETRPFSEVFGEIGNLCVGAMNRDLGSHFPHLGMSTPYMLEGLCAPHIDALSPSYVSRHRITINDTVRLHATLCLCAYAPLDFRIAAAAAESTDGGIEFF